MAWGLSGLRALQNSSPVSTDNLCCYKQKGERHWFWGRVDVAVSLLIDVAMDCWDNTVCDLFVLSENRNNHVAGQVYFFPHQGMPLSTKFNLEVLITLLYSQCPIGLLLICRLLTNDSRGQFSANQALQITWGLWTHQGRLTTLLLTSGFNRISFIITKSKESHKEKKNPKWLRLKKKGTFQADKEKNDWTDLWGLSVSDGV